MHGRQEWQSLVLAVQFLTRLPMPDVGYSEEAQARSMGYYPLVGLGIGACGALVLAGVAWALPGSVAVLLSIAATLLLTGALHEDGLADCADGLGGGATCDRALEIMRDSRVGSYGVLALGMTLAIKASALATLTLPTACALLIAGQSLSRMAAVTVISRHSYARATGAKFAPPRLAPGAFRLALGTAALVTLGLLLAIGPGAALAGLAAGTLAATAITRRYLRQLGGFTGDCLGATQQLAETGLYLGALAWLA